MKSKEVLKLLQITRPTLTKYVREGTIKVKKLPNGRYEYDNESVYMYVNGNESLRQRNRGCGVTPNCSKCVSIEQ